MPAVISSPSRNHLQRACAEPALPPAPPWAVLSFLSEDLAWCEWFYRAFDGARFPRVLLGRPSRFGNPYPERISVFPDPEDTTQLANYPESLQVSQHLILVVSPASGNSQMLLEHMRLFKAAGGEDRIVALVVKGEPGSPTTEVGCEADREWLPKSLAWRFENNTFQPAEYGEPIVIDARPGVASLAEVQIRLTAALLEIEPKELTDLGVVIRTEQPTPSGIVRPPVPAPAPTPVPAPVVAAAPEPPRAPTITAPEVVASPGGRGIPRHSRWLIRTCGLAAVAAVGALAFWPEPPVAQPEPPRSVAIQHRKPEPLVEAVPAPSPEVAPTPPNPAPAVAVATPPPSSAPSIPLLAPELVAFERKRHDLVMRRDRLVRMAENRATSGEVVDALESFDAAIQVAKELTKHMNHAHNSVIELCVLYRRVIAIAASLSAPSEARRYYELVRRSLFDLKTSGSMPKEATKVLAEIETALRVLPRR